MIPTISLRGEAYAIGHGLGQAFARFVAAELERLAPWLAIRDWLGSDRLRAIEDRARREMPRYVREIEGLADGAGWSFAAAFLWNCRGDLPGREAEGCTTVMVPGRDRRLVGHNEDGHPGFRDHCLLATVIPDGCPGFTSFVYPGSLPGNSFAVNAAGLVQTINNLRAHDLRIGLPRQLVARAVLDARDLDEALSTLARTDRAAGYHHALAQAGDARLLSVEAPASGLDSIELQAPTGHANHLVGEALDGIPQRITRSSAARQRRAAALADRLPSNPAPADLCRILGDRADPVLPIYRIDASDGDEERTLATALFEIGPDGVTWRVFEDRLDRPTFEGRGLEFRRCETMLP